MSETPTDQRTDERGSVTDPAPDAAPNPRATEAEVRAAYDDPKLANVLYHDWEADTYDEKWSISYDDRCVDYAVGRFHYAAGVPAKPFERALELGCGTGFFLLNLMQGGIAKKGSVTDLSPGMVQVALRNAENLGLDVDGRVGDAERIPYPDDSFDLVVGHAVLHHIPDVEAAMREVLRVLKPGGRFVFAGDPTRVGDFYARRLGRATWWLTTRITRLPALSSWRRPQQELGRVLAGRGAGGRRRSAHLRALGAGTHRAGGGRGARARQDRGVHRRPAGVAGTHLRGGGTPREAGLRLGDVRLSQLAATVLVGLASAELVAEGSLLQRPGDRSEGRTARSRVGGLLGRAVGHCGDRRPGPRRRPQLSSTAR